MDNQLVMFVESFAHCAQGNAAMWWHKAGFVSRTLVLREDLMVLYDASRAKYVMTPWFKLPGYIQFDLAMVLLRRGWIEIDG